MEEQLKCFLSAPFETDLSTIKSILGENQIETFDLYDFSIGDSIQQILKRKLRQADFAIFVVSKDSKNILYEIGVCEGLGKQALIIIDKEVDLPFYLDNKLSLSANLQDRNFLKMTVLGFLEEIKSKRRPLRKTRYNKKTQIESYNDDITNELESLLTQTQKLRQEGQGRELEYIVEETFKTIKLKYADNSRGPDVGIDFALWSNKLGRVLGNPIIVEVKFGRLGAEAINKVEMQLQKYAENTDANVALLLYLDRSGKRIHLNPSLKPLIIAYDVEDFITDLINDSFEQLILTRRNKIAHGN